MDSENETLLKKVDQKDGDAYAMAIILVKTSKFAVYVIA